jgi:hypothetical protein
MASVLRTLCNQSTHCSLLHIQASNASDTLPTCICQGNAHGVAAILENRLLQGLEVACGQ